MPRFPQFSGAGMKELIVFRNDTMLKVTGPVCSKANREKAIFY